MRLDSVSNLLRHRGRHHLANLLAGPAVEFVDYHDDWGNKYTSVRIHAVVSKYEGLRAISDGEKKEILETIREIWSEKEITEVLYRLDVESLADEVSLLSSLDQLRDMMISVSTGGPRIEAVNPRYKETYSYLTERLEGIGLSNHNPYADLWDWYGKWSSGDLPTYRSRRNYVRNLLGPIEDHIRKGSQLRHVEVAVEPTGWSRVDRGLDEARRRLEGASTEEQFQAVGLFCREVLTSLAQAIYDPSRHPSLDGVEISDSDVKRMFDSYLETEVAGGANANTRKYARAAYDLALELQHKRTAAFRQAAFCLEATASVVSIVAILSGVRDP